MALEIKELKVKIDVIDKGKNNSPIKTPSQIDIKNLKAEIIAECLARMNEMFIEKLER